MAYKDPEKKRAYDKDYREANRETLLAKQKAYYEANRETRLAKQKAYDEANREYDPGTSRARPEGQAANLSSSVASCVAPAED